MLSLPNVKAATLAGLEQTRLQPFGVSLSRRHERRRAVPRHELPPLGAAQRPHWPHRPQAWRPLMLRGRRTEARFDLRDPRLELLQLFARLQQHLRLRIEFRTGDDVELGETALEHRLHVLFYVLRRRVLNRLADTGRQFVERFAV